MNSWQRENGTTEKGIQNRINWGCWQFRKKYHDQKKVALIFQATAKGNNERN